MNKKTQRRYTAEQKGAAVELAREIGAKKAGQQLNIPFDTLYTWVAKARKGELNTETTAGISKRETSEMQRLKDEIKQLKNEKKSNQAEIEMLKKEKKIQEDVIDFFIGRQKR